MIRNWVAQADRDAGRHADGLSTAEREEIRRRRRENHRLREERAMAWSAGHVHVAFKPVLAQAGGGGIYLAWTTIDDLAGHDLLS